MQLLSSRPAEVALHAKTNAGANPADGGIANVV
jgi:hypothetical protein